MKYLIVFAGPIGLGQLQTSKAKKPPPHTTSIRPNVSDRYIIFKRSKKIFRFVKAIFCESGDD